MFSNVRRIVTGHDANGKSVFLEDGPSPQFNEANNERVRFHELWNTVGSPAPIAPVEPKERKRGVKAALHDGVGIG